MLSNMLTGQNCNAMLTILGKVFTRALLLFFCPVQDKKIIWEIGNVLNDAKLILND